MHVWVCLWTIVVWFKSMDGWISVENTVSDTNMDNCLQSVKISICMWFFCVSVCLCVMVLSSVLFVEFVQNIWTDMYSSQSQQQRGMPNSSKKPWNVVGPHPHLVLSARMCGLVVARLPAAREVKDRTAPQTKVSEFSQKSLQYVELSARAAHLLQCTSRLSLPSSVGR